MLSWQESTGHILANDGQCSIPLRNVCRYGARGILTIQAANMYRFISLPVSIGLLLLTGQALAQIATDVQCTACVGADDLAAASVSTSEIANGAVRNVDLGANSVTSGKIKDGNVNLADLSPDVQSFLGASIASISVTGQLAADIYVAGVECPSDRIPVSSSCGCSNDNGNSNYGFLALCALTVNGATAECYEDALTYDPLLEAPVAVVVAHCLGAISADGTPWIPGPSGFAPDARVIGGSDEAANAQLAEWHASQHAAFESKLSEMKKQSSIRRSRILRR